jgi:hypothetical protein
LAIVLASRFSPARGASISSLPYYMVTTSQDIPAASASSSGPQAIFEINPPGAVVPPVDSSGNQTTPLTIRVSPFQASDGNTYTTAGTFSQNPQDVIVGLKTGTAPSGGGAAPQMLGLSFLNSGLGTGQDLIFSLNVADPNNPPTLVSQTPGVSVQELLPAPPAPVTPTTSTTETPTAVPLAAPTSNSQSSVPEPLSISLWSALTGAGLLRARALRRRQDR